MASDPPRQEWRDYLAGLLRGRSVICALAPLAAYVDTVALLEESGTRRPLLVATGLPETAGRTRPPDDGRGPRVVVPARPGRRTLHPRHRDGGAAGGPRVPDIDVRWDSAALHRNQTRTGWTVTVGPNAAGTHGRLTTPPDVRRASDDLTRSRR